MNSANSLTLAQKFVNLRYTEQYIARTAYILGLITLTIHLAACSSDHWVHTVEPRQINVTGSDEQNVVGLFAYYSGYWRMCRDVYVDKETNITNLNVMMKNQFEHICMQKWFLGSDLPKSIEFIEDPDLEQFYQISKATAAILDKNQSPAFFHCFSIILAVSALFITYSGFQKRNIATLFGAVTYILSGMALSCAIVQYIVIVDEEMMPRLRPTVTGEPSGYRYKFGWSLHVACATFTSIQICGIVNMIAFLRRYNRIEDILKIVPGLTDKIDRYLIKKARHQLPVHQHDHYRHPHSPHVNYDWQVDRPVFEFEWPLESPEEAEDFQVDEMESDGLMKSDWTLDTGVDDDLRGGEKRDYDILHENGDLFTEV